LLPPVETDVMQLPKKHSLGDRLVDDSVDAGGEELLSFLRHGVASDAKNDASVPAFAQRASGTQTAHDGHIAVQCDDGVCAGWYRCRGGG